MSSTDLCWSFFYQQSLGEGKMTLKFLHLFDGGLVESKPFRDWLVTFSSWLGNNYSFSGVLGNLCL